MIFDHFGEILLWIAQIGLCVCVVIGLVYPINRARQKRLPPGRWKATITAAQKYKTDYYQSYSGSTETLRGEVAVRIVRSGGSLTIGTVKSSAEDFEDALNTLVSEAEDRANALNAAEEILR